MLLFDSSYLITYITDATVLLLGAQMTFILHFFLARNIRIARERAWDQTITSRGKGPDFWGSYVEEWDVPPPVDLGDKKRQGWVWATGRLGLFVTKKGYHHSQALTHGLHTDERLFFFCSPSDDIQLLSLVWHNHHSLVQGTWNGTPFT
jgi:hypothetical protein